MMRKRKLIRNKRARERLLIFTTIFSVGNITTDCDEHHLLHREHRQHRKVSITDVAWEKFSREIFSSHKKKKEKKWTIFPFFFVVAAVAALEMTDICEHYSLHTDFT